MLNLLRGGDKITDPMERITDFMEISARTAPKSAGQDYVETKVLARDELNELADSMIRYGEKRGKKDFDRDAENVRNSDAVLLTSLKEPEVLGLDCGACGFSKCKDLKKVEGPEFKGPNCAWRLLDLGIALGSAAKTASLFNVDSRIMYRIGAAARNDGLIEGDIAVGIPISASGKSIYFDR